MTQSVNHFTVIESVYGRFIVNRHCSFQAEHLIKTGLPHIDSELRGILAIVETLPHNCVVVDAGANIGLISIPIAQAIKKNAGVVHAFEVQRMMHYALCGAAALNDLTNLFAHHLGLGARSESRKLPLLDYGQSQDFGTLSLVDQEMDVPSEPVGIVPLDAFGLPRLDFLKVDVEGMELDVLRGSRRMLESFEPWCWVEYWITGSDPIKQQFEGLAYEFYRMDQFNMLCAPKLRLGNSSIRISGEQI